MPKYESSRNVKLTTCYCTICEREHKMLLNWKGRGVPRKFCLDCRMHKDELFTGMDTYDLQAVRI